MNSDLQRRLLPVFHYALRQDGFLFLGPAETVGQRGLFAECDRANRVYRRVGETSHLPDFPIAAGGGRQAAANETGRTQISPEALATRAARQVLERTTSAYVIIDAEYEILEASAGTGRYLELPSGRPSNNLSAMMRKGLSIDVRAALSKVLSSSQPDTRKGYVGNGAGRKEVAISVELLQGNGHETSLYLVIFQELPNKKGEESTPARRSGDDEAISALERELYTTKDRLQSTLEELETSNEELRSSNEEISSVNEELQSSNEELETSKEELQSINEELRTVNNELNCRIDDLGRANNDLRNLLVNTQIPVVFLDRSFRIRTFTPPAKSLFRLRDHDLGRPLDELAGPLDYSALKAAVKEVVSHGKSIEDEIELAGDHQRAYSMRIMPYRDERDKVEGAVLAFIDITELKRSEKRLSTMVSELNHRVKNALASVQAIVRQTSAGASSVPTLVETIDGRLQAMAAAHNLLSAAQWEHVDLEALLSQILTPYAGRLGERLLASGPQIELHAGCAVAVALILNELATNAAKYGAWTRPTGRVSLEWRFSSSNAAILELVWTERGGPVVQEPQKSGFGQRYIKRSVTHELKGTFNSVFEPQGFSCTFSLPVDRLCWTPGEAAAVQG
jgi:two-component system CheB/CheR fusion protein